MLPLAPMDVVFPTTLDEARAHLVEHGANARIVAGGTDLVPNLKHGLLEPATLVSLKRISLLRELRETDTHVVVGAMVSLTSLTTHPLVLRHCVGVAVAAKHVAGPQLRQMGTIGGNICLDTRCLYYNQTYFWRESLGFCLKKDGSVCHVVAGGKKCVAAASNDVATMLVALNADVEILGRTGTRVVPLRSFYVANGIRNNVLDDGEIVVRVWIPKKTSTTRREGFAKLRHRYAIDFPLLSVAVVLSLDAKSAIVNDALVVNALQAKPRLVNVSAVGEVYTDDVKTRYADAALQQCHPMTNIADDPTWRREMVPIFVARALDAAFSSSTSTEPHAA